MYIYIYELGNREASEGKLALTELWPKILFAVFRFASTFPVTEKWPHVWAHIARHKDLLPSSWHHPGSCWLTGNTVILGANEPKNFSSVVHARLKKAAKCCPGKQRISNILNHQNGGFFFAISGSLAHLPLCAQEQEPGKIKQHKRTKNKKKKFCQNRKKKTRGKICACVFLTPFFSISFGC